VPVCEALWTDLRLSSAVALCTLVRKPDGKWSAQENAGHMLDLEALWIVRIADYVNGSAQLTEADLTNRQTDEANHNATPTHDIVVGFRTAREQLLKCAVFRQ
jgi:hypothetical protein